MHPCLNVQEILWIIFDSLLNDAPSRENTSALISLAITCHTFEHMALDILWRTQRNLVPLIKCMPTDLWTEDPTFGFNRTLVRSIFTVLAIVVLINCPSPSRSSLVICRLKTFRDLISMLLAS